MKMTLNYINEVEHYQAGTVSFRSTLAEYFNDLDFKAFDQMINEKLQDPDFMESIFKFNPIFTIEEFNQEMESIQNREPDDKEDGLYEEDKEDGLNMMRLIKRLLKVLLQNNYFCHI